MTASPSLATGTGAAFLALLCWAFPGVLGRGIALAPMPLVAYRIALGVLLATALLHAGGKRLSWRIVRLSAFAGVCLGLDLLSFFIAIKTTTVANATVIGSLQPLFLMFLAPMMFGERIRWPDLVAAVVAIGGVALVVYGSQAQPGWHLRGDLWAVVTLVSWTGYFVACKRVRRELGSRELTAGTSLVAALVVTPFALLSSSSMPWPTPRQWAALTTMAVLGWCGHVLMTWALGHIPVWLGGTASLASPAMTTLLAALVLDEPLAAVQLLGMAVVVAALSVVTVRAPKVVEPSDAVEEVIEPPVDEHAIAEHQVPDSANTEAVIGERAIAEHPVSGLGP